MLSAPCCAPGTIGKVKKVTALAASVVVALSVSPALPSAASVSPVAAVSEGVGTPGRSTPGQVKTPCGLVKVSGVGASGWAARSTTGRAWAWQGRVTASPEATLKRVVGAIDRCPNLGILTTDWDSDGLEEKTVMITGRPGGRPVTILVYLRGSFVTVAGAEDTKPYRQERDVLVKTMRAQGVALTPVPGT